MILTIFLILIILVLSYVIFNLFKKVETLERWMNNYIERILLVNQQIHEIDVTGAFKSDDEVGTTFDMIKDAIANLTGLVEEEGKSEGT